MDLLESYISAVVEAYLQEDQADYIFSMDRLKTLKDPHQVLAYVVRTQGQPKGEGTGRKVYRLWNGSQHSGTVLKVAKNAAGIAQNQTEMAACGSSDLFPKIFDSSPEGFWIVVEEASSMTRVQFKDLTGMSWGDFIAALAGAFPQKLSRERTREGDLQHNRNMFDNHFTNPFFRKVLNAVKDCKYEPGDISKLDSWGIVQGKPVITDSGYTEAVHQAHYQVKK